MCPGFCVQPSVLVLPTFALTSVLFSLGVFVVLLDIRKRKSSCAESPSFMQDRLLKTNAASSAESFSSLRRTVVAFCTRYFRGFIETASSYMLTPCTFVFVLNVLPSSFHQADLSERVMVIATPIIALLFRALVIRQRVVDLSPSDQKQLYVCCVCTVAIALVFGFFFGAARDVHQATPSFASATTPLYVVLALLAFQLIAQTFIRQRATRESVYDDTDWIWSTSRPVSSAQSDIEKPSAHLRLVAKKSASAAVAIAAAKFALLNYLILSQMAMIIAGLGSAGATSRSVETASIAIGAIPLVASSAMLLHNAIKLVISLRRNLKCLKRSDVARDSSRGTRYAL